MITYLKDSFIGNWRRRIVALIGAVIIWTFVNNSITITKTIPNVSVEVVNIPPDKTIEGLKFGNILERKRTLTLKGKKSIVDPLSSDNLRIIIDAADKEDTWIVKINKLNLRCLDSDVDLSNNIKEIGHSEFQIHLSPIVTEKIPVIVTTPIGDPPQGYQFLDVWPQLLPLTVKGPKKGIEALKTRGLELTFNLKNIDKEELDALQSSSAGMHGDEIDFIVPEEWKYIDLPSLNRSKEKLSGSTAEKLRITFLRKELLPLPNRLPIYVFYSGTLTYESYPLIVEPPAAIEKGTLVLITPLYTRDVSRLFLDVVQENIQIVIIAAPKIKDKSLQWIVQFIDPHRLEDLFVEKSMYNGSDLDLSPKLRERHFRSLFRSYMQQFKLFIENGDRLNLKVDLKKNGIKISSK